MDDAQSGFGFDVGRLEAYLKAAVEDFGSNVCLEQIHGGSSNPTYVMTTDTPWGERRYILRKSPLASCCRAPIKSSGSIA